MTRIDFHINVPDPIAYGCRLVRKITRSGLRLVIYCDDPARLRRFDDALWSFAPLEFIAHLPVAHPFAARTPVLLTADGIEPPATHCGVLVSFGARTAPHFTRFERVVEIVGANDDDRALARERFRHYKDRGYPLDTHRVEQ